MQHNTENNEADLGVADPEVLVALGDLPDSTSNSDIDHQLESDDDTADDEEEEKWYEHFSLKADPKQGLLRIDKFVASRLENTSRSRVQNALHAGFVLVNGKAVKPNYRVHPNDAISIVLPRQMHRYVIKPEPMNLSIVYEDDDLIVLNKPAGLVVHPGCGNKSGTLVHGLAHHFANLPNAKNKLTGEEITDRPGIIHRIDKDTSGLIVVAKSDYAMTHLAKQFFDHTVVRRYVALVWGNVEQDAATITGNLDRSTRNRKIMEVYPDGERGKHAITHYKVLERLGYVSVVECRLETGRTHQIRVHFRWIGHPLFNDDEYGGNRIVKGTIYTKYKQFVENCFTLLPRQALHAQVLGFKHPKTGQYMHFESPLPADMHACIEKWRNYMRHHEVNGMA